MNHHHQKLKLKKILKNTKVKLETIEDEIPINNTSEIEIKKTPTKRTKEIILEQEIEKLPEEEI